MSAPTGVFSNILCPVDFSDASTRALAHAVALTRWCKGKLTVLHVADAFVEATEEARPGEAGEVRVPGSHADLLAKIQVLIDQTEATGLEVRPLAIEGHVTELIVSSAQVVGADLLVLGTHGLGGFQRLFLGSVAEKVLRVAPCPVLTVPPHVRETTDPPVTFSRILCPLDFSPASLRALDHALRLAKRVGGRVTVLNVVEYLDDGELFEDTDGNLRRFRDQVIDRSRTQMQELLTPERTAGCEVEQVVVTSRAYRAILDQAESESTDLIVMGTQGLGGVELMLYGSTTQHVIRRGHCPVLAVRA